MSFLSSLPAVGPNVGVEEELGSTDGLLVRCIDGKAVGSDEYEEGSADGRYNGSEVGFGVGFLVE